MQTQFYMFPISLKLSEREVQTLAAHCDQGAFYAVQYLQHRYRYLRHIDAIRVVKRVRSMVADGSIVYIPPVTKVGGIVNRYASKG